MGTTFLVTADLAGLAIRARAVYQDAHGVLENVFSATTALVADAVITPAPTSLLPDGSDVASAGVHLILSDLQFILDQIKIAERDAAGEDLLDILPNSPRGLSAFGRLMGRSTTWCRARASLGRPTTRSRG